MSFDGNGNMLTSQNGAVTWNAINMPLTADNARFDYSFSGEKIRVQLTGDEPEDRFYLAGAEIAYNFDNSAYEKDVYHHADGRLQYRNAGLGHPVGIKQFKISDHLGNLAVLFTDTNEDGHIAGESEAALPEELEVLQRHYYYPFGMNMEGTWAGQDLYENLYQYNGKELAKGLGWYAYGFRHYDQVTGRFTGVDPIADRFAWVTTYNYAEDEPVGGIDLHGLQYVNFNESFYSISMGQTWAHTKSIQSGRDAYGISYTGTSVPIQQVKFGDRNSKLPIYSGSFARSLQSQGENLGRMYDSTPRAESTNKPDKRFGSTKAYNQGAAAAAGFGKAGLSFIIAELSVSALVRPPIIRTIL